MDVNGTRFHMLTGADDWEPRLEQAAPVDLRWDDERAGLGLLPHVLRFSSDTNEAPLTPEDRRGADSDAYGNIYWIDDDRRGIRLLPAGHSQAGDYWRLDDLDQVCAPEGGAFGPLPRSLTDQPLRLCGLAVTREHYLVAGSCAPGGLFIFDLHGGGPPRRWQWPAELIFAPFDLAAAADGGVWILARRTDLTPARLWRLDCHFQFLPWGDPAPAPATASEDFVPMSPESGVPPARASAVSLRPGAGLAVAVNAPIAVQGLPDDSVLILGSSADGGHSVIVRYRDGAFSNRVDLAGGILDRVLEDPHILAHDFAFLAAPTDYPDQVYGELSLVLEGGNQALVFGLHAFHDEFELTLRPRYVPLRRFSGKALVSGIDAVYYDLGDRWYPLTAQPRCRFAAGARLEGLVFDGGEPGCVWHRVLLDACIPKGASVEVYTRAGEDRTRLDELEWTREPTPYLRGDGAEVVLYRPFSDDELAIAGTGTWELLVQQATGRYIELALVLAGDGRTTPRIRAMRLYYPRYSYLQHYLPAVYREEPHSASFLDRYLANAEGIFSTVEDRIARAEAYFDSRTVPGESLAWLASWLGAALEEDWDEPRKRLFIENAPLLFRWRGTLIGMRALIRLATEPCPDEGLFDELRAPQASGQAALGGRQVRIVERFLYRELPGVVIGDPTGGVQLQTLAIADVAQELGDAAQLNEAYRAFLERRYAALASTGETPMEALDAKWGTTYVSFTEIAFTSQLPSGGARSDWLAFVQRELALSRAWAPAQGAYALHVRYQEFLRRRYAAQAAATSSATAAANNAAALDALNAAWGTGYTAFEQIRFSPVLPASPGVVQDWLAFLQTGIGFTYAPVGAADLPTYRQFLARRYRNIGVLNTAYGLTQDTALSSFDAVALPAEDAFPQGGSVLTDWIQFVSLTLPIRRNAHRFTVLVPTEPGELPDTRAQRIGQVKAIVQREKPAHTDYDVKLFWALFQVGSARLGEDTVLGDSARYVAIVLGGTYLSQGLLASGQPWNVSGRSVLGRDPLG